MDAAHLADTPEVGFIGLGAARAIGPDLGGGVVGVDDAFTKPRAVRAAASVTLPRRMISCRRLIEACDS